MRVGFNPHKDVLIEKTDFLFHVIIPVYIPNQTDYFKDSLEILKLCINSLFSTISAKTFITIVNNGSCNEVKSYLNNLYDKNLINEVIQTENIGKLNSIIKGLSGHSIPLVTISDADVMFLPNWQNETLKIYNTISNVGVVGLVPQFNLYKSFCENFIFSNLLNPNLSFQNVVNPDALIKFYDSIGWDRNYNKAYLEYILSYQENNTKVVVGSGHVVATFRRELFSQIKTYIPFKLGGISERYFDELPIYFGLKRFTTFDNYAFHMGNTLEDWMYNENKNSTIISSSVESIQAITTKYSRLRYIKSRVLNRVLISKSFQKRFFRLKKLPNKLIQSF